MFKHSACLNITTNAFFFLNLGILPLTSSDIQTKLTKYEKHGKEKLRNQYIFAVL